MARLTLSFLGPFQAGIDSLPVKGFESDKVRALLAYLVVEAGQPHRRDSLAALFWPEQPQETALKNLRHVVYKLRQVIEGSAASETSDQNSYLIVTSQTVQFNAAADFHLDMTEFTSLVKACEKHTHRRIEVCGACHARLKRAADLYRGSFLAGFSLADSVEFEEWMLLQREELHQQAGMALTYLAAYEEAHGDDLQAASYARKKLEIEPWNEEAHRHLIRLLWVTKQRTAALAQYRKCVRALSDELGIEPNAETEALHKLIMRGDYKPGNNTPGQSLARTRHNLPVQITPFIGREQELIRIAERLESADRRLITILGPGGIGKSRLALNAAANQLGTFEDGVYFVPMAPVESPDLIASTIAQSISLHFSGKQDEESQLLQYLANKEMLLVMDNLEHLLKGTVLFRRILEVAPRTALLVTSREQLNLQAETVIEIGGLDYPATINGTLPNSCSLEQITQYPAVKLFVERAAAIRENFSLTTDSAASVVEICNLVGGLPLAIELAAVQVLDFSCEEIARTIRANLDFLSADMHDVPLAHSSIRAVFNYSWDMLLDAERGVLRRLCVFRGGWDGDSAERVAGASRVLLRSLAGKSLIRRTEQSSGVRYDIHEVLRQYSGEQLDLVPDEKVFVQERHAAYFLELAEAAEPNMRGPQQEMWLHRLDVEHSNLQAAIRWASEAGHREIGLRLGGALWQFWVMHAHYATGRALLSGLELERYEATPAWAKALFGAGRLALQQGDHVSTQAYMEQSIALYKELGDDAAVRQVMIERARAFIRQGNYSRGEELAGEVLQLAREANDLPVITGALTHLGHTAANRGDFARSRQLYTECLKLYRTMEDRWGISWILTNLGNIAHGEGDTETARRLLEESLAIRREIGDKWGIAACLTSLGDFAVEEGHFSEARTHLLQALSLRREIGDAWAISESFIYLGYLEYAEGKYNHADATWTQALIQTYAQQNYFFSAYCLSGLAAAAMKKGNIEKAVYLAGMVTNLLSTLKVQLSRAFQGYHDEVVSTGQEKMGEKWASKWTQATSATLEDIYNLALN